MHAQHDRNFARRLFAAGPRDPARRRVAAWSGVAGLVVLILILAQTPLGKEAAAALGFAAGPRPYTELAFGPAFPPATQPAGTAIPVPVDFVVGNGSDTARTVSWRVAQDGTPLAAGITGRADLGPQQRIGQETTVLVTCAGPTARITVATEPATVSISHTITCTPRPPAAPTRRTAGGQG